MKRYAKPQRRQVAVTRDVSIKSQQRLMFATTIIAAVSAIAAAFSAYIGLRQVELAERERNTPFRTADYTARLDAYRQIIGHVETVDDAFVHEEIIAKRLLKESDPRRMVTALSSAIARSHNDIRKTEDALVSNTGVWDLETQRRLRSAKDAAVDSDSCFSYLSEFEISSLSHLKVYCGNDIAKSQDRFYSEFNIARASMDDEIRRYSR